MNNLSPFGKFATYHVETTSAPDLTPPPPMASDPPINKHHKGLMQVNAAIKNQLGHVSYQLREAVERCGKLKKAMATGGHLHS